MLNALSGLSAEVRGGWDGDWLHAEVFGKSPAQVLEEALLAAFNDSVDAAASMGPALCVAGSLAASPHLRTTRSGRHATLASNRTGKSAVQIIRPETTQLGVFGGCSLEEVDNGDRQWPARSSIRKFVRKWALRAQIWGGTSFSLRRALIWNDLSFCRRRLWPRSRLSRSTRADGVGTSTVGFVAEVCVGKTMHRPNPSLERLLPGDVADQTLGWP